MHEIPPICNASSERFLRRSTSNCGNPALRLFGFGDTPALSFRPLVGIVLSKNFSLHFTGPVVSDGFGLGYIIKDEGMQICCTSFRFALSDFLVFSPANVCLSHNLSFRRQTQRFVMMLHSVFDELKRMIEVAHEMTTYATDVMHRTHKMMLMIAQVTCQSLKIFRRILTLPANFSGVAASARVLAQKQRRRRRQGWCGLECDEVICMCRCVLVKRYSACCARAAFGACLDAVSLAQVGSSAFSPSTVSDAVAQVRHLIVL
jgi:hypothetical protein